jgi:plasmid stability protein
MRAIVILDDRLGQAARVRARFEGRSLSALVSSALEAYLARLSEAPPFRLVTVGGGVRPGIDLDRPSALLAAEDESDYGR